jgi:hypothetical protein
MAQNLMPTERLFVSYSRKDKEIVTPVVKLMRLGDAPVFQDLDGIEPGKKWRLELSDSIAKASKIVVFWCSHSSKSKEVAKEWKEAKELGKDIVPALMDSTPVHPELSEYHGLDLRDSVLHARGRSRLLTGLALGVTLMVGVGTTFLVLQSSEPRSTGEARVERPRNSDPQPTESEGSSRSPPADSSGPSEDHARAPFLPLGLLVLAAALGLLLWGLRERWTRLTVAKLPSGEADEIASTLVLHLYQSGRDPTIEPSDERSDGSAP